MIILPISDTTLFIYYFRFIEDILHPFPQVVTYTHFHNILRLFDGLPNFPFTTSETMRDYYLQALYIQVASRVAERLKI